MFTGLIEKTIEIENFSVDSRGAKLSYEACFDDVKIGDSIAVNGACLTVCDIKNSLIYSDVMPETLEISNLKNLKKGDLVNLERAMSIKDRLEGHIVSGHIDCCAKVNSVKKDGFSKRVEFLCDSSLIILKGSIAINGVCLTVSKVFEYGFEVSLIPSTIENTNLKNLKIGDIVNIEYDILGKYIKKFLKDNEKPKLTLEFLRENGF